MRRKILLSILVLIVAALAFLGWHLWPALYAPENIDVGTPIGETVPIEMPLRDASGNDITLAELAGPSGTVLVMVRSADWCPFCKAQLKDHAQISEELKQRGYTLASLSYDQPEVLAEFAAGLSGEIAMLSDSESRFIDAVGLRDPQYGEGHFAQGVPRASVLVLAPDGTITAKLVSADYRQRPDNDFVLGMVDSTAD